MIVDNKALMFVLGTVMDYKDDELSSEFTFANPNSKGNSHSLAYANNRAPQT